MSPEEQEEDGRGSTTSRCLEHHSPVPSTTLETQRVVPAWRSLVSE